MNCRFLLTGLTMLAIGMPTLASAEQAGSLEQAQTVPAGSSTGQLEKRTFLYATKGGQQLYLDRIIDRSVKITGKRSVIIHSVGGGWEAGARDERTVVPFLNYLANLGYEVISIDYRLGIKAAKAKKEFNPQNAVAMYLRAVNWGVEDLFDATSYVLKQADDWNIDKEQIVILGGSAGAVNSLTAEWNVANETELARAHLPKGFRYSGVVAMAGAFWLKANTPLEFKNKPAPIMFFHGGKDSLVTYDEVQGPFSGYGPAYYVKKFAGPGYPKWFFDFPQGDHVLAASPMIDQRREIAAFLQKLVKERQQVSIHSIEEDQTPKVFVNFMKLYGDRYLNATGPGGLPAGK